MKKYRISQEYDERYAKLFPPQPSSTKQFRSTSHGSADWLDVTNKNFSFDNGIPLGLHFYGGSSYPNPAPYEVCTVRYSGKKHLVTIAPSGAGKGVGVQIPVLLEHDASIFMIDPKGENAIVTANYRKNVLKQDVFILNPFGVLEDEFGKRGLACHGFNPLQALNPENNKNFVADVAALSEALIVTEGNDPYWSNSARELVSCLIMSVCCNTRYPEKKNLVSVRELLAQPEENLLTYLAEIVKDTNNFKPLRQKASLFTNSSAGTSSIISTAISQTSFLDDPCISSNLCSNDFNFNQLKEKPTTIFLILPARFMVAYSKWFRLLITSALDTLMSKHTQPKKPVLFMLDECATIGYLPSIETAVGLARGYGIQIWSFFQDIHQLKDIYGKRAESFLANSAVQQYFTPNDTELAERISKRIGNTTIKVTSYSNSSGESNTAHGTQNLQSGHASSSSDSGVPLIYAADILGMDNEGQILFFEGKSKPVYLWKNNYYRDDSIYSIEKRYESNPYYEE